MKIRDRIVNTQARYVITLWEKAKSSYHFSLYIHDHQLAIMAYRTIPLYWRGEGVSFLGFQKGIKLYTILEWEKDANFLEKMKSKEWKNSPNPFLI